MAYKAKRLRYLISMDARFSGIQRLYGMERYKKIANSSICVIGIGGVGSWAVEALARSGVMNITMIDMDDICITNTNRQLHTLEETVGLSKIDVMKNRIYQISPQCNVLCHHSFITKKNLNEFSFSSFDYIIDAIDSLHPKACLINYCLKTETKLITIGAGAGKTDPTKIMISDLFKSENDKLLKRIKKLLRKEYDYNTSEHVLGIDAVYSSQRAVFPDLAGGVCFNASGDNNKLDCDSGMGTASFITGALGFAAASRVLENL